jgi:hypothetical protein
MLNNKGDKFVCQVTKLEVEKRFYIPVGKKGEGKLGCYADANCALYALEHAKSRGYEVRVKRLLEALDVKDLARPSDVNAWSLDNPGRFVSDKFTQTVDEYKAELARIREVASLRKKHKEAAVEDMAVDDDDVGGDAAPQPPTLPATPPPPRPPPPPITQPLIRVQITHRDRIANAVEEYYTHDVRQLLREKAGLFQLDSTIPMSFTGTPNQIVVYPRLVNDPRHLRATPIVATISYPSAMGFEMPASPPPPPPPDN